MSAITISFIVVYLLFLIGYFITKTSGKMLLRASNKIVLATMYLVFAAVHFSLGFEMYSYHLILMTALFFAWLGDVFLIFDLNRGGDFFLCGNVCFAVYEMALLTKYANGFAGFWWVIVAVVVMVCTFVILAYSFPNVLKLGKMKWPMALYISSISLHGFMGLAVMIACAGSPLFLLGLGSLLFMISDYILTADRFVFNQNKWSTRANSAFYFVGLLLIVLGFSMFGGMA